MSVPVVLVAGVHAAARTAVVDRLLRGHPRAVAVHHDLRAMPGGLVTRTVRDGRAVLDRAVVRLDHGCVTCTVREDLVPELLRRAAHAGPLVVDLWDCVEPRTVAEALDAPALRDRLRLTAVLTAVDAELMPVDICRGERLAETGAPVAPGDGRYLAGVLAHQIEYATALAVPGLGAGEDDLLVCRDVLRHLAPLTPVVLPGDPPPEVTGPALCTRELADRVDPATALLPCPAHSPTADTVVWRRTAPLHPARFFAAMDVLAAESVRSRGRFWLTNRPDRMLAWDAVAGVVTLADAGVWLAALPEAAWDEVRPARRVAAALDWSAEHGDRVQHLVMTGPGIDADRIHALLDACLLGPDESGAVLDDPFAAFFDAA
ncbi:MULTISPECIES: CobW family GTP-binding protein [Actinomadura]|uniref:CobW family GTP-binding protein n=1 Tax=Actinomadura TaxID=1988 RepID=UPI001F266C1E|nr:MULTISPECIES: GTP-binding protein [Actinomadura]